MVMRLSLAEFRKRFPDEQSCAAYLSARRWPTGFVCPSCRGRRAYSLPSRGYVYECLDCRRQTSITAGTVLHRSKLSLLLWFSAAHLIASHPAGISSREIEKRLRITYKTAWLLKQKLRHSINSGPIDGTVEVGLTAIPCQPAEVSLSTPKPTKIIIAAALEVNSYQLRLAAIQDDSGRTIVKFVKANVKVGTTLRTKYLPNLKGYLYDLRPFEPETPIIFYFLKEFLEGRHEPANSLIGKFVANHNVEVSFDAMLGIMATHEPASYWDIIGRYNPCRGLATDPQPLRWRS